ncbi:MAG: hypothetical protein ABR956_10635 [Terracidiphilus sp.]|jgi:hypothetical protein
MFSFIPVACAFTAFHVANWSLLSWLSEITAEKVLWFLRFTGLVLLTVVLFRKRSARRYPFFTISRALSALYMVTDRFLAWRLPVRAAAWGLVLGHDVIAFLHVMVVVELGRRVFERVRMRTRLFWMLGLIAVGLGVMTFWGPRPTDEMLGFNSQVAVLKLLRVVDLNLYLLGDLLAVELGLLAVIFGRRYKGSWRSQSVQIVLGLAVASLTQLSIAGGWQAIVKWAYLRDETQYEHLIGLQDTLFNIASAIYVGVLVWWIVALWTGAPEERQRRRRKRSWQTAPAITGDKPLPDPELVVPEKQ